MIDATQTLAEITEPLRERCDDTVEALLEMLDVVHQACRLRAQVALFSFDVAGGVEGTAHDAMWARLRRETGLERLDDALLAVDGWIGQAVGRVERPSTTADEVRAALR